MKVRVIETHLYKEHIYIGSKYLKNGLLNFEKKIAVQTYLGGVAELER